MMMMRLKYVSSSIFSSLCRNKAINPIFSSPPKSLTKLLLRYSSSSSSSGSSSRKFPPCYKSRFDNPYIDRNGYPTIISLEQLEEFLKKYPVFVSNEDLRNKNCSSRFYYIPHPTLEDMFIEVPITEITFPLPSGCEHLEVKYHDPSDPNFEDTMYDTSSDEGVLDAYDRVHHS